MSHQKVTSKFPTNQQAAARRLPCLGQHAMKAGYQLGRNFIGYDIVFDGFHGEAHEQPEAYSERSGKRDLRGAYGLHAREMCAWLMHLQQARAVNVVFLGILETATDDFGRTEHRLQMEGSRTSRELPAVVDQVITMQWIDFGDGKLTAMSIWRWDRDPELIKLGWPPPIRIRSRKFRSRIALENFKRVMARRAIEQWRGHERLRPEIRPSGARGQRGKTCQFLSRETRRMGRSSALEPSAFLQWERRVPCVKTCAAS